MKLLYKLSCIRARSASIPQLTMFETQTIANNIISSVCTTNSIVASLMMLSEENLKNYFLTLNKRIITEIFPSEKNPECSTCSKKWIIMRFKHRIQVKEIFEFLAEKYECKFILDNEGNYFSHLPYNLDTLITIQNNTIFTLGCKDVSDTVKIYFQEESSKLEIIKELDHTVQKARFD